MAKHPHKLILIDKRTWKCVLDGCRFFVHRGLEHVLPGKTYKCWNCDELYTADDLTFKEPKPRCIDCRMLESISPNDSPVNEPAVNEPKVDMSIWNEARIKLFKEMGWPIPPGVKK